MGNKVYFITGGGTGGHIYPAVAVADGLLEKYPDAKIYYIGNPQNMEAAVVENKSYKFLPVLSSGMPRKLSFKFVQWGFQMFFALLKCCYYTLKYKPDVIFGTGGYVSAPVLLAGIIFNKPYVMHDCDAIPGLVTRHLSPKAACVSVAFDEAKKFIKNNNCYVNGNPIRKNFAALTKDDAKKSMGLKEKLTLCVMGGSQGAKTINDAIIPVLKTLISEYGLQIIFQTGRKNYDEAVTELKEVYPDYEKDENLIVKPYFDDMVTVLKASDIAISRAGSLSISELCASGVCTIFVPYPYAAADHQRKNAKVMTDNNAGLYLEDNQTNPQNLMNLLKQFIIDKNYFEQTKENVLKFAKYDGVEKIIAQIEQA